MICTLFIFAYVILISNEGDIYNEGKMSSAYQQLPSSHHNNSNILLKCAIYLLVALLSVSFVATGYAAKKRHVKAKTHRKARTSVAKLSPIIPEKYAAIVVDFTTGNILYSRNPDAVRHPASLTKMMTLYLVFEALDNGRLSLIQQIPVSAHAANQQPSRLGLRPGQTITVQQAILAVVTKSANDAATVLAEAIGGSEGEFAEMMTRRAKSLGMQRTVYINASGLPNPNQVTTAGDLAKLSLAILHHFPSYYHYFSTKQFIYQGHSFANHNHLLNFYQGLDGIKTGYINASGFNLSASAERNGKRIVAVVMGGRTASTRDKHMAELLDQGFEKINGKDF